MKSCVVDDGDLVFVCMMRFECKDAYVECDPPIIEARCADASKKKLNDFWI
jgi:hypothetical protein